MRTVRFIIFPVFFILFSPLLGQTPPYLKSATLYLSVDGWADIWLNGIPIRESQPSTPETKGIQTIQCLPEHLCYFQDDNVLAIENANAYRSPSPFNSQIGIAYLLRLRFSDDTEVNFSSNDFQDLKAAYLPNKETGEPLDWQKIAFRDDGWSTPYSPGFTVPGVAPLMDLESRQEVGFLSAAGSSFTARYPGERHLYRLQFYLNISPNPICSQFKIPDMKRTAPAPRIIPTTPRGWPQPTLTTRPTLTPISTPVFVWRPTVLPTGTSIPAPVPVWAPVFGPVPTASFTPVLIGKSAVAPTPTRIPAPVRPASKMTKLKQPTPTPVPAFGTTSRVEPIEKMAPPVVAPPPQPTPTLLTNPQSVPNGSQTIVFNDQPANIYISYADGPGAYRLEVTDTSGSHLRNLFEKRVVAQQDDWVDWDGKDDWGREEPPGRYIVLYTKDGKILNELVLIKTGTP